MWSEYSLEVVDAVARNGSFSAAAQELHRVPSAVSYTVRQLEEWLAVPLFERRHRDVELTRRGLVFTGRALCYQKCRSPASSVSKLRTAGADSCRSQWMIL